MSESADFDPGPWRGAAHSFSAAYDDFASHAGRSYAKAVDSGKTVHDLVPARLTTKSTAPLVIGIDITGSMGKWPKVIFSKLPYLEVEARTEYLGKDMEICWGAIGDAYNNRYPLQVRPFTKGVALKDELKELVIEGGGGGTMEESYELFALYMLKNVEIPNAIRPILIMIGDEQPYPDIDREKAKSIAQVDLSDAGVLSVKGVFDLLQSRFSVYMVLKPYNERGDNKDSENATVRNRWISLLGSDRVVVLPSAERVVDVIFGILARETNKIDYFRKELEGRQNPDQVKTVYRSLRTIHELPPGTPRKLLRGGGKSMLHGKDIGKDVEPLV